MSTGKLHIERPELESNLQPPQKPVMILTISGSLEGEAQTRLKRCHEECHAFLNIPIIRNFNEFEIISLNLFANFLSY